MEPQTNCPPPYSLLRPAVWSVPVILTSPHSGRDYDPAFLAASRLDAVTIRRSEDSFVEELFGAGPALGMPLLAANFPRAYCDVNREAWELDPAMFADELPAYVNTASPRVQAGLGTIARIVGANEPIYAGKMRFAEAQARIAECWTPYHAALQGLIDTALARFGACLVIDCHSMPSLPGRMPKAQVVLGDSHGTSSDAGVTGFLQGALQKLGLEVQRNDPYSGGFITRFYGRPGERVHVVQLEVARGLYMNERHFRRNEGFAEVRNMMDMFLRNVAAQALHVLSAEPPAMAAE